VRGSKPASFLAVRGGAELELGGVRTGTTSTPPGVVDGALGAGDTERGLDRHLMTLDRRGYRANERNGASVRANIGLPRRAVAHRPRGFGCHVREAQRRVAGAPLLAYSHRSHRTLIALSPLTKCRRSERFEVSRTTKGPPARQAVQDVYLPVAWCEAQCSGHFLAPTQLSVCAGAARRARSGETPMCVAKLRASLRPGFDCRRTAPALPRYVGAPRLAARFGREA
jgi:hypothetical protein